MFHSAVPQEGQRHCYSILDSAIYHLNIHSESTEQFRGLGPTLPLFKRTARVLNFQILWQPLLHTELFPSLSPLGTIFSKEEYDLAIVPFLQKQLQKKTMCAAF